MQNLRDKLLKAGLVTETQVKKALEAPKPPPRPARPPQQARPQQPQRALSETEQQAQQAFRARDAEVSEVRRKEAAKAAEAKAQSERARALRALVQRHRLTQPPVGAPIGDTQFHFVRRSGKVGRLLVTAQTQALLEQGAAAVVENPGQPDPVVLPAEAAKEAYRLDPRSVFFWNGPQKPIGFEDVEEEATPAPAEEPDGGGTPA